MAPTSDADVDVDVDVDVESESGVDKLISVPREAKIRKCHWIIKQIDFFLFLSFSSLLFLGSRYLSLSLSLSLVLTHTLYLTRSLACGHVHDESSCFRCAQMKLVSIRDGWTLRLSSS